MSICIYYMYIHFLMTTKVQKWGNSLAVRLPKELSKRLSLEAGNSVVLRNEGNRIIFEKAPTDKVLHTTADWKQYIIPMKKKKKENISENIDHILYGAPRR